MTKNKLMVKISILLASLLIITGLSFIYQIPTTPTLPTSSTSTTSSNPTTISTPFQEAFDYAAQNLNHSGKLVRKSDGYVYLKVDDAYIYKLFPMLDLKKKGFRQVDSSRSRESPGAHISVFYKDDHVKPKELGYIFQFELKKIKIVKTAKDISYVVLVVESPELENLRKKYGHSPKLHGHEFHISLGKKIVRNY